MVRVAVERSKLATQPSSEFFFEVVTSDVDLKLNDSISTHF